MQNPLASAPENGNEGIDDGVGVAISVAKLFPPTSPRMFEFAANTAFVSTFLMSEPSRALRSAKKDTTRYRDLLLAS